MWTDPLELSLLPDASERAPLGENELTPVTTVTALPAVEDELPPLTRTVEDIPAEDAESPPNNSRSPALPVEDDPEIRRREPPDSWP
jgi:hypothetical protein